VIGKGWLYLDEFVARQMCVAMGQIDLSVVKFWDDNDRFVPFSS
jgi:hypothetical protein